MNDPFFVLGVSESADDDEVKRRYLALVRAFPPSAIPSVSRRSGRPSRSCAPRAGGWSSGCCGPAVRRCDA